MSVFDRTEPFGTLLRTLNQSKNSPFTSQTKTVPITKYFPIQTVGFAFNVFVWHHVERLLVV